VLDDGEPADPPAFVTVIPEWHPGDEFLAGAELQRFRKLWPDDDSDVDENPEYCTESRPSTILTARLLIAIARSSNRLLAEADRLLALKHVEEGHDG
jgi:hypothetical protein